MRIRVGYGTAFFLLLISYLLTLYANRQLLNQAKLVDHTNKVIIHLETMLSSMKDAETGTRGYILTNNESFLKPYLQSQEKIDSVFAFIRGISDTQPENSGLMRLAILSAGNTAYCTSLLITSQTRFPDNRYIEIGRLYREGNHGPIRSTVSEMQTEEQVLLKTLGGNGRLIQDIKHHCRYISYHSVSAGYIWFLYLYAGKYSPPEGRSNRI